MARNLHNLAGRGCAWVVGLYRRFVSPLKPPCCRFTPTCSAYSREAFLVHGFWKGMGLTIWRVLRCHPFYHGNLNDPVPPPKTKPRAEGESATGKDKSTF